MTPNRIPGLTEILAAAERLRGVAHRTPLLSSRLLSERVGAPVFLKCENLQRAGSFKLRGAYNKACSIAEADRRRGLVTYSSGNHAQGVALAARLLKVPATCVMPEDVRPSKRAAVESYGARVFLAGTTSEHRRAFAEEIVAREGAAMVPPFDDPAILAGQGTVGLEIVEDCPQVGTVCVPVGGGGLCGGIACAVAARAPEARVIAVEPEGADGLCRSLEAGRVVRLERTDTIADGLRPLSPGAVPFAAATAHGVRGIRVTDAEIVDAMRFLLTRARLVVEPSGAAAVAALLAGKIRPEGARPVVAVLSGGNAEPDLIREILVRP
ncbi:MAG: threonine/serine dehydratase [Planctomycetales bacterium]|nr:threonine/serine dehydratase [Planctomycetales bacterium]